VNGVIRWLELIGARRGPILVAHSVHLDAHEVSILADRGVAIAHNVALGTDGAASNNSQDMFEVIKFASLLQRGRLEDGRAMGPGEALQMATMDAARALGLDDWIGSVEPGKRADLVVLDLLSSPRTVALHDVVSQIVHCADASNVESVFVDGELRVHRGEVVGVDEPRVLAKAQTAAVQLVDRLGLT
jgi:5-methylthioadenosine/S-adenosylhomocysteine deaminase